MPENDLVVLTSSEWTRFPNCCPWVLFTCQIVTPSLSFCCFTEPSNLSTRTRGFCMLAHSAGGTLWTPALLSAGVQFVRLFVWGLLKTTVAHLAGSSSRARCPASVALARLHPCSCGWSWRTFVSRCSCCLAACVNAHFAQIAHTLCTLRLRVNVSNPLKSVATLYNGAHGREPRFHELLLNSRGNRTESRETLKCVLQISVTYLHLRTSRTSSTELQCAGDQKDFYASLASSSSSQLLLLCFLGGINVTLHHAKAILWTRNVGVSSSSRLWSKKLEMSTEKRPMGSFLILLLKSNISRISEENWVHWSGFATTEEGEKPTQSRSAALHCIFPYQNIVVVRSESVSKTLQLRKEVFSSHIEKKE